MSCECGRCLKPGPYRPGDCEECWFRHNPAAWGVGATTPTPWLAHAAPTQKTPARRPLPCLYLGRILRRAGCGTCRRDDVRRCEAGHGEVTQNGTCEQCPDYEAE